MKVGDLVFELPMGRLWKGACAWFKGDDIGIVTKIVDHNNVIVLWPTGQLALTEILYLEVYSESR